MVDSSLNAIKSLDSELLRGEMSGDGEALIGSMVGELPDLDDLSCWPTQSPNDTLRCLLSARDGSGIGDQILEVEMASGWKGCQGGGGQRVVAPNL